jgi:hypothetical protein
MQRRYIIEPDREVVPSFWEPRPWDSPEAIITESESKHLGEQLKEFTPARMADSVLNPVREKSAIIQKPHKKLPIVQGQNDILRFLWAPNRGDFNDEARPEPPIIQESNGEVEAAPPKWKTSHSMEKSQRRMRTRSERSLPSADDLMLCIPTRLFETDTSDCETDPDVF